MSREVSIHTSMFHLSNTWSRRARRIFEALKNPSKRPVTILQFYVWFMCTGGKQRYGFSESLIGVGFGTYEEIRRSLIRSGFPNLNKKELSYGYCQKDCPKELLKIVLTNWQSLPGYERRKSMKIVGLHHCDGH